MSSAPRVEVADLPPAARATLAGRLGAEGKPMPAWARRDPDYRRAYETGRGGQDPEDSPADSTTGRKGGEKSPAPAAPGPAARPAQARGAGRGKSRGAGGRRPGGAAAAGLSKLTFGGDGGGFMLAIFLYPIVLSVVQHGAKGPGLWLKAKLLNQTTPPYSPPAQSGSGGSLKQRPV